MTPKRIEALQWFHDNPGVIVSLYQSLWPGGAPSRQMASRLYDDGQIANFFSEEDNDYAEVFTPEKGVSLTDKGRQDLREATR